METNNMTLHDLFLQKLSVLYDVEKELVKVLPKLAEAASDEELSAAFEYHLEETKTQVKRLEEAFALLEVKPDKSITSSAIRGIAEDGEWVINNVEPEGALDANLIAAASYAEHYEIAGYTVAREWSEIMGHEEVTRLLEETLAEEIAADEKLMTLGKERIFEDINEMSSETDMDTENEM